MEVARRAYDLEATANEIAASLSILVEHGERLSLHDEHCLLCAATRTNDEFAASIQSARARIDQLAEGVNSARDNLASGRRAASRAEQQVAERKQSGILSTNSCGLFAREGRPIAGWAASRALCSKELPEPDTCPG